MIYEISSCPFEDASPRFLDGRRGTGALPLPMVSP